jgi:hypothetical protein
MAIQMRRGNLANYDASKMLPGEFGVALDEGEVFISIDTGDSKRVLTEDDMDSPALTGTPTAPTAATSTNDTQVATTAFVRNAIGEYGGASTITATESDGVVTLSIS